MKLICWASCHFRIRSHYVTYLTFVYYDITPLSANECQTSHAIERIASLLLESLSTCSDNSIKTSLLCRSLTFIVSKSSSVSLLRKAADQCNGLQISLDNLLLSHDAGEIFVALSIFGEDSKAKETFQQTALPSSNNFPLPSQLALAEIYISRLSLQEIWDEILPSWGLKLRSHPDKVLPLLRVLLGSLAPSFAGNDVSNEAWKDEQQQLLETVGRLLKSTKNEVRDIASQTLILLSKLGLGKEIGEHLADALSSLGSSELRLGAYVALNGVASVLLEAEGNEMLSSLADKVLTSMCAIVPKDKNSTDGAKEVGFTSLLSWMQCSKRAGRANGYEKALDYFIEVIEKYATLKGEFRFRLGNLVVSPAHSEAFAEGIIADLFEKKSSSVSKGLEAIIEPSSSKFKSTDTIPQTDGILATFLIVSYAQSKGVKVPASIAKVFKDGSFLYGDSVLETAKVDILLNYMVHRTIAIHCKISIKNQDSGENEKPLVRLLEKNTEQPTPSAAARALAVCVANSLCVSSRLSAYSSALSSLKTVITYCPISGKTSQAMILALFTYVNECSLKSDDAKMTVNSNNDLKEVDDTMNKLPSDAIREPLSEDTCFKFIRRAANMLVSSTNADDLIVFWKGMLLTHAGSTECSSRRQRVALVSHFLDILKNKIVPISEQNGIEKTTKCFADFIALCAAAPTFDYNCDPSNAEAEPNETGEQTAIGRSLHNAAFSTIVTLGGLAGNFDPEVDDADEDGKKPYSFAYKLCTDALPSLLVAFMSKNISSLESLTDDAIALYQSPQGVLFKPESENGEPKNGNATAAPRAEKKKAATRKVKSAGGGFDAFADEEWEREVKKDLAKKKAQSSPPGTNATALSPEDKKLLSEQTLKRKEYSLVIDVGFRRTLAAIRCLCESDIEIGNTSLPFLGMPVIKAVVSECSAFQEMFELRHESFNTLSTLAGCVYEIDEIHAPTLAQALAITFRKIGGKRDIEEENGEPDPKIQALPSVCAPVACVISEIDDYGDCLSGNSFAFLFPVISAILTGPRNITGCESALKILERHFVMLDGDEEDPIVKPMRKEIALALLELLTHDRAQTFVNPTPYEALIGCYTTNEKSTSSPLSAPEIQPLLGERGSLGPENNRFASMETFASIARCHSKFLRSNPLIENRMWLNCHAVQARIKTAARKAWLLSHEREMDDVDVVLDPPSRMYAVPLLTLLSHDDTSIASAAALSLAAAMELHPESSEKNIVKVCNLYIASFPTPASEDTPTSSPFPVPEPVVAKKPVKKVIDTSLKKKPTAKKTSGVTSSLAKITGKPAPKKKKATHALIAKTAPKERTLDANELMGQFVTQSSAKQDPGEADKESKIAIRLGVLRSVSALTESAANIKLDLHTLKILVGFLIAFGLGDKNEDVRNAARDAARDIVARFGSSKEVISFFLPQFESVIKTGKADVSSIEPLCPEKVPQTIESSDYRKEGVVILLGSIALHLNDESEAEKIDNIIDMLLNALKTPVSESSSVNFFI